MIPLLVFMPTGAELFILFVVIPIFFVLPMVLCVKRAEQINRDKIVWGILGFIFGYIAVLILYLLSSGESQKKQIHTRLCPYCGEEIFELAKKCKYCGEWLEGK